MNNTFIAIGISAVAIVIAIYAAFAGPGTSLGNKTASFWDAASYRVAGTEVISAARDINQGTSDTATSSFKGGCIQTVATSTATPWKLLVVATTTQIAPGYNAVILAKYGTCPSI